MEEKWCDCPAGLGYNAWACTRLPSDARDGAERACMTMSVVNQATVGQYGASAVNMGVAAAKSVPVAVASGTAGAISGGQAAAAVGADPALAARLGAVLGLGSAQLRSYLDRYRYWGHGKLCTPDNDPSWADVMKRFWLEDDLFAK